MGDLAVDTGQKALPGTMFDKLSVDTKTGKATIVTTTEELEKAQQAMTFMDNAMVEMQKEGDRIAAQEQQARSRNPVLAALSAVASHLGSQPDMPGFVRGLAGANREMNPDPDMLAMKKLPLYMQVAKLAEDRLQGIQRQQQINQQGAAAQQNADSLALYREQNAGAAADRANTTRQATLDRMARGERPLTIKQVLAVDPKMGLEEAQSWVEQSKANHEDRQLEKRGKRALVSQQEETAESVAALNRARRGTEAQKQEYQKARTKLLPAVTEAKIRLYDAQAFQKTESGQLSHEQAAFLAEKLANDIEKFNIIRGEARIRLLNEIEGNPLMPETEKEELRAKLTDPKELKKEVVQREREQSGTGGTRKPTTQIITGPGGQAVQITALGNGEWQAATGEVLRQNGSSWKVVR